MKRKAKTSNTSCGSGAPFDLDSLIADDPKTKQAARATEIATAVGEMVRRIRLAKGVSQPELARRTGSTQAHISELERGLGPNGPTIGTLGRIVDELGDQVVVETNSERAARKTKQAAEAESWLANLLTNTSDAADDPEAALNEVFDELRAADSNLFKRMLLHGVLKGLKLSVQTGRTHVRRSESLPSAYAGTTAARTGWQRATSAGGAVFAVAGAGAAGPVVAAAAAAAAGAAVSAAVGSTVAGLAAETVREAAAGAAAGAVLAATAEAVGAVSADTVREAAANAAAGAVRFAAAETVSEAATGALGTSKAATGAERAGNTREATTIGASKSDERQDRPLPKSSR